MEQQTHADWLRGHAQINEIIGRHDSSVGNRLRTIADEIEALTAERDRLRAALEFYATANPVALAYDGGIHARAALRGETEKELAEARRKAAVYDAGTPGWMARIDGELIMTTLTDNPGDLAANLNGSHEIVAVRIVEVPQ